MEVLEYTWGGKLSKEGSGFVIHSRVQLCSDVYSRVTMFLFKKQTNKRTVHQFAMLDLDEQAFLHVTMNN